MIPLFIWILCLADIVYLIKIDILGSRIKVMKKWCLRIFIWRYKGICLLYSPRMWRWSYVDGRCLYRKIVFSTYVEVILIVPVKLGVNCCILHVCGGDPTFSRGHRDDCLYSPRMWRWSLHMIWNLNQCGVFSTYVEVILKYPDKHAMIVAYSPRMWRWSFN